MGPKERFPPEEEKKTTQKKRLSARQPLFRIFWAQSRDGRSLLWESPLFAAAGYTRQISRAYWAMVRSEENFPAAATFFRHFLAKP